MKVQLNVNTVRCWVFDNLCYEGSVRVISLHLKEMTLSHEELPRTKAIVFPAHNPGVADANFRNLDGRDY